VRLSDLKKSSSVKENDSFYVSFSDLLMLLCVFFVLLVGIKKIQGFQMLRFLLPMMVFL